MNSSLKCIFPNVESAERCACEVRRRLQSKVSIYIDCDYPYRPGFSSITGAVVPANYTIDGSSPDEDSMTIAILPDTSQMFHTYTPCKITMRVTGDGTSIKQAEQLAVNYGAYAFSTVS